MTPMCFPYRRTESALSFFGSNFIARLLRAVFVSVGGVEGPFLSFTRLVLEMVANERLHDGHQGTGDHNKVTCRACGQSQAACRSVARFCPTQSPRCAFGRRRGGLPGLSGSSLASHAPVSGLGAVRRAAPLPQHIDTFFCIAIHD